MTTTAKDEPDKKSGVNIAVGRRVFLGITALGLAGILFGARVQTVLSNELQRLFPWWPGFRIHSVAGSFPEISESAYRLTSIACDSPRVVACPMVPRWKGALEVPSPRTKPATA